jgi:flagellar basal body-associated protein FliL
VKEKNDITEKKKKKFLILLFLLIFLLVLGSFVSYKIFFDKSIMTATVTAGDFLPEGKDASTMTDKEKLKYAQKKVDDSDFNMRIISKANFNKETMHGDLAIQNPPQNFQPVNVVINLDNDRSKVYESGAIQPGEEIKEATLTKKLNPGSYSATATFTIYNPDSKRKQGEIKALLTLIVDN